MSKGIFITGTDTDIGKTYITAMITKKLRENGIDAGYYKAVLSGAREENNILIAEDAEFVLNKAGLLDCNPNDFVTYNLKTPASPHLSSNIENIDINMDTIIKDFKIISNRFKYVTVEGCGGLVCPIYWKKNKIMLTDIIKSLNLDIIIVSKSGLGSINSSILTLEYAKQLDITVKAFVLNNYDESNFIHVDNKRMIEELSGLPVFTSKKDKMIEIEIDTLKDCYKDI